MVRAEFYFPLAGPKKEGLTKKVRTSKNEKYMARPGGLYIFKEG
jgi:hypothetical protein